MYQPYRSRGRSSGVADDTFHQVYLPLLKVAMKFSFVKYIALLMYCIRSMQQHLTMPVYCQNRKSKFTCDSSSCFWLHNVVLNLPRFVVNASIFVEQCAYLLIVFSISCVLFLYAVYLVKHEADLKIRYRAILTLPSLFFELVICFLSYYSTITSIFAYSSTASTNPEFYSSAFVIFAFIISLFYALLLVTHFATLYYIMIFPIIPLSIYAVSNANYSGLKYTRREGGERSLNYETISSAPLMSETYGMSLNWQQANDTRGTGSTYSQVRSWNNTLRSTNTNRNRDLVREDDNDYLELI